MISNSDTQDAAASIPALKWRKARTSPQIVDKWVSACEQGSHWITHWHKDAGCYIGIYGASRGYFAMTPDEAKAFVAREVAG